MKNVGIIGQGFVGTAVREKFRKTHNVLAYDKFDEDKSSTFTNDAELGAKNSLEEVVKHCDIIFTCVPTPMFQDGECDTSIVADVVTDVAVECDNQERNIILILKSTVPPGTTNKLNNISDRVTVVFSPEFLTEANSIADFDTQDRIVFGVDYIETVDPVTELFRKAFPDAKFIYLNSKEAEMTKYMTNLFLATKVSFFNDMYSVCEKLNINYTDTIEAVMHDPRIGKSHFNVPGPDGDRGYGGHCVPGDCIVQSDIGELQISDLYEIVDNGKTYSVLSANSDISNTEMKEVLEVTKNKFNGELLKFTLENGSEIKCTPEHLFPILRNGQLILSKACDITNEDEFYTESEINNKKTLTYDDIEIQRQ